MGGKTKGIGYLGDCDRVVYKILEIISESGSEEINLIPESQMDALDNKLHALNHKDLAYIITKTLKQNPNAKISIKGCTIYE